VHLFVRIVHVWAWLRS